MKRLLKITLVLAGILAILIPVLTSGRVVREQRTRDVQRQVQREAIENINANSISIVGHQLTVSDEVIFDLGAAYNLRHLNLQNAFNQIRSICPYNVFSSNAFTYQIYVSSNRNNWTSVGSNLNINQNQDLVARYIKLVFSATKSDTNEMPVNVARALVVQHRRVWTETVTEQETYYVDVEYPDPTPTPTPRGGRGGNIQRR